MNPILILLMMFFLIIVTADTNTTSNSTTCPVSLNYVQTVPWNSSLCLNFKPLQSKTETQQTLCCQALLSLFGIALAEYLHKNSLFHFHNIPISEACLQNYQSNLTSLSLPNNLVSSCFDPSQFVSTPNTCVQIQTKQDWLNQVNSNDLTVLDNVCEPDLTDPRQCQVCQNQGTKVQQMLTQIDGLLYFWYIWWVKKRKNENLLSDNSGGSHVPSFSLRVRPKSGLIWFEFKDLVKVTDNFSDENFIGRGGFGSVYKGVLPDGTVVAVKRIEESDYQGDVEFYREVGIVSSLKHRNLVPLRGCCVVGEDVNHEYIGKYLVYDYMPNGNLKDHLFPDMENQNGKQSLTWSQRKNIILDVANALVYLHFGVKPPVYHRDIKATNILLDADWVWSLMKSGNIDKALDVSISMDGNSTKSTMERFLVVGILCCHVVVALRPTILDALKIFIAKAPYGFVTVKGAKSVEWPEP
ncbi:hypothetical protein P8452_34093 [Trifolium repens]|nr:hypothetical protein P8452_34093 [Trifolium repens]